jgi:transmembrane sensor
LRFDRSEGVTTSSSSQLGSEREPVSAELLDRYLAGRATFDEHEQVTEWLAVHEHQTLVEALRQMQPGMWQQEHTPVDVERAVARLRVGTVVCHDSARRFSNTGMRRQGVALGIGATVLVMLGAIVGSQLSFNGEHVTAAPARIYTTAAGEQKVVALLGGGRVHLGPRSTITVTGSEVETQITLHGQALFTVIHQPNVPLTVRTMGSRTRVLGTTFFVRRYDTDLADRVVVAEGRVAVSGTLPHAGGVVVAATQGVIVVDSGRVVRMPSVSIDDYTSWTRGRLVFNDTPVREILADVARVYDVDLRITDTTLANRKLTWAISVAESSIDNVLGGLATVLDAHVERKGKTLSLVPGRAASRRGPASHPSLTPESQYGR